MLNALLTALFLVIGDGKPPAPTVDPCGDRRLVSQAYTVVPGKVTFIRDSVTLVVSVDPAGPGAAWMKECAGAECVVRLVDLVPPSDPATERSALAHLQGVVAASDHLDLAISPVQNRPGVTNVLASVAGEGPGDLNEAQLEAGFAQYHEDGPYAVDWHLECRYQAAERRAREARRGLWAPAK